MYPDIYYEPGYGEASVLLDAGQFVSRIYEDDKGKILHAFLLREIPERVDGKIYYDLITPYGYGGPVILECFGDRSALVKGYMEDFTAYCRTERIVSEFVRFHPLLNNAEDFTSVYDVSFLRPTVATDLSGDVPFEEEFSKSARKSVRRALRSGVDVEIIDRPSSLDIFMSVYYDTMDRKEAGDFYYFSEAYFSLLLEKLKDHITVIRILFEGECISAGLYFHYGDFAHAHLSGTKNAYLHLSPAYLLKYYSVQWAKEKGCKWLHYGGGTDNSLENSLYRFKSKFTKKEHFRFHIGKKIYLSDVYEKLVVKHPGKEGFFPAYRG